MTKELEEDIEHELKWLNSPCRATREEARANLFKIINNLEKPTCNTCKFNTVGQDEYIKCLEELENRKLERRAKEWLRTEHSEGNVQSLVNLIKEFTEQREKRIIDLEAQIEKMKCGQNCKHSYLYQEDRKCKFIYCDCINCKDKWELRR